MQSLFMNRKSFIFYTRAIYLHIRSFTIVNCSSIGDHGKAVLAFSFKQGNTVGHGHVDPRSTEIRLALLVNPGATGLHARTRTRFLRRVNRQNNCGGHDLGLTLLRLGFMSLRKQHLFGFLVTFSLTSLCLLHVRFYAISQNLLAFQYISGRLISA